MAAAATDLTFPLRDRYELVRPLPSAEDRGALHLCRSRTGGEDVVVRLGYRTRSEIGDDTLHMLQDADPRFVLPISVGSHAGQHFEVQDHVDGGSLEALAKRRRLRLAQLASALDQITGCLEYLHDRPPHGLVHLNLKPSNILVRSTDPMDLVLTDVEHAVLLAGPDELSPTTFRRAAYAPPELRISTSNDWWSLGIVLRELFVGVHPFQLSNGGWMRSDQIDDHLRTKLIDVSQVQNQRWRLLLLGLLTRDPDLRWTAAQIREWQAGGSPATHGELPTSTRTARSPLLFSGGSHTTLESLAEAMATNWNEARELVLSQQPNEFTRWLKQFEVSAGLRLAVEACRDRQLHVDRLVGSLITELGPGLQPRFRHCDVDPHSLAELARTAENGAPFERDAVHRLHESQALIAYSVLPGLAGYADLNDRWQQNVAAMLQWARYTPQLQQAVRDDGAPRMKAALLLMLADRATYRERAADAAAADTEAARSREWFNRFVAHGTRGPSSRDTWMTAYHWAILALAPLAEAEHDQWVKEQERAALAEQERLQAIEDARRRRREAAQREREAVEEAQRREREAVAEAQRRRAAALRREREAVEEAARRDRESLEVLAAHVLGERDGPAARYLAARGVLSDEAAVPVVGLRPDRWLPPLPEEGAASLRAVWLYDSIQAADPWLTSLARYLADAAGRLRTSSEHALSQPAPERPPRKPLVEPGEPPVSREATDHRLRSRAAGVATVTGLAACGGGGAAYRLGSHLLLTFAVIIVILSAVFLANWFYLRDSGMAAEDRERYARSAYVSALAAYRHQVEDRRRQDAEWERAEARRSAESRERSIADRRAAAELDAMAERIRQASAALSDHETLAPLREVIRRRAATIRAAGEDHGGEQHADGPVQDGAAFAEPHVVMHTNRGSIRLRLFSEFAPATVRDFVDLVSDRDAHCDGMCFVRVISGFLIQGGGATGDSWGGRHRFSDEIHSFVRFGRPYLLAMPTASSDVIWSHFFITVAAAPHLDGSCTIFGEVADEASRQVVDSIAGAATSGADRPLDDVVIERLVMEPYPTIAGIEVLLHRIRRLLRPPPPPAAAPAAAPVVVPVVRRVDVSSRDGLKSAVRRHPEAMHACPFCPRTVKGRNLVRHVDNQHEGQLPR